MHSVELKTEHKNLKRKRVGDGIERESVRGGFDRNTVCA